jgi:NAD binding domain of 6-phosphogluconate dehydrogenase/NAD-binding of NADP-dependent 3-hydroxyisobutyrate dehydrogenase
MNATPTPVAFIGLGLMGGRWQGTSSRPAIRCMSTTAPAPRSTLSWRVAQSGTTIRVRPRRHPMWSSRSSACPRTWKRSIWVNAASSRARPGAILIDMTTSSPSLAKRIAAAARAKGLGAIDAPVSGGDIGARDAKLSIMIGGEETDFAAVMPILQLMGTNIRRQGGPGAGRHTKLANQIVIAGTMLGVAEGLAYAGRVGLDPHAVLARSAQARPVVSFSTCWGRGSPRR